MIKNRLKVQINALILSMMNNNANWHIVLLFELNSFKDLFIYKYMASDTFVIVFWYD